MSCYLLSFNLKIEKVLRIKNSSKGSLDGNNITSNGASLLLQALRESNSTISFLSLVRNPLDDGFVNQLGEFIRENQYILSIFLDESNITDKGIEILSGYMVGNATLKVISFNLNEGITDKSIPILIKIIETSHIDVILIRGTTISKMNVLVIPLAQSMVKHGSTALAISNM